MAFSWYVLLEKTDTSISINVFMNIIGKKMDR